MQKIPQPRKWYHHFDKWSAQLIVGLLVVGLLFVIVDIALIAAIVLQNQGVSLSELFAFKSPPVVAPTILISPATGEPGATLNATGKRWQAHDPLVVQLEDPWAATCPAEVVATLEATADGSFSALVTYPSSGCWSGVSYAQVVVRSLQTEKRASAGFQVLALVHTPTPTSAEPMVTPTQTLQPSVTAGPTTEPTATLIPGPATATPTIEPTATNTATPTATPTPTETPVPAIVDWRGEYFDNVSLVGNARVVRSDRGPNGTLGIGFNWGYDPPAAGLPADGFSARWTRALNFEQGRYRFYATMDDGLRLFVDGDLVINEWRDGSQRQVSSDRWMTYGKHTLRVEYYERSGMAVVRLGWEQVASYPDWKGEYWPNMSLGGNPALVRNDGVAGTPGLDFNWREGSPGSAIPPDGFSARWTRQAAFEAGTYRFHALIDDGVRLWLNDLPIIDAWSDHDAVELTTDYTLARGTYTLKVEYYERIGNARIRVWWEKVTPSFPDWKGEYWPNRNLHGNVALVRNDRDPNGTLGIDFIWGPFAPASSMPTDNFSVRWTRKVDLEATTYRFHAVADDGMRLWIDGVLLIDKWQDQEPREWTADRTVVAGKHEIKVEYYEHSGGALIHVWWETITATPVPIPSVGHSSATYIVSEGTQSATITVVLSSAYDRPVTVDYATAGGTASGGSDYVPVNGRLTFDPGVTSRTFAVSIIEDTQDEADETVTLVLSNPGNATLGATYQATLIIADNDEPLPPPQVQFSAGTYNVSEGAQSATITVLLSSAYDRPVTVDYATAGGAASGGSDYIPVNGRLTFDPGVTSRTFAVSIIEDTQDEADETVTLVLSNPGNAALGATYQATLTIVDNDEPPLPPPQVQFSADTYSADEGAQSATITVVLSGAYDRPVTVDVTVTGGTADAGSDYEPVQRTLTFEPGITEQTFIVHIIDDQQDEEDETIVFELVNAQNAQPGNIPQATLAIVDNDTIAPSALHASNLP